MMSLEDRLKRAREREQKKIDLLEELKQSHRVVLDEISKRIVRIRNKAMDERSRIREADLRRKK